MDKPKTIARREMLLRTALVGMAGALMLRSADQAFAQHKLSKQDAGYQDTPKDDHACGDCTLFQPPKSCKLVDGDISEHGWCKLFEEQPE